MGGGSSKKKADRAMAKIKVYLSDRSVYTRMK